MKKLILFAFLLPLAAFANQRAQGDCYVGAQAVVTSGLTSTTKVLTSYPNCTVSVFLTGTMTLATIYSDNSSTPLANPFTCPNTPACTNGHWFWYAANGRYDVQLSGGGLPAPWTIGDILLADPSGGSTIVSSITAGNGISTNASTGAVTVTSNPPYNVASYFTFTQSPSGSLSAGNNTITLAPVPFGVNWNDPNNSHPFRIAGTGTPETCYNVTAGPGTATSGSASGTITISCSGSHSPGFTIASATGGVYEAANVLPSTGGTVIVDGTRVFTGTATVFGSNRTVQGFGSGVIDCQISSGDCLAFDGTTSAGGIAANNKVLGVLIINAANSYGTSRVGLDIISQNTFELGGGRITTMTTAVKSENSNNYNIRIHDINLDGLQASTGVGISAVMAGDLELHSVYIAGISKASASLAGIRLSNVSGVYADHIDVIDSVNNLLINPGNGQIVSYFFCTESCIFDEASGDTALIAPTGTGAVHLAKFVGSWTNTADLNGLNCSPVGGSAFVYGLQVIGHTAHNNTQNGIIFNTGCQFVIIEGSTIAGNSVIAPGTYSGIVATGGATDFKIHNNIIGGFGNWSNTQKYDIDVDTSGSNRYSIIGNNLTSALTDILHDAGTGTTKIVSGNIGIGIPTIASGATVDPGTEDPSAINLTGNTTVTAISRPWDQRQITFLKADGMTITVMGQTFTSQSAFGCTYSAGLAAWFCH